MTSRLGAGGDGARVVSTIEELTTLIQKASWFKRLGEPGGPDGCIMIPSLEPWANAPTGDERFERIADQMNWLPSSRDEDDPVHGRKREEEAAQRGKREECSRATMDVYKLTLASLRGCSGHPALKIGSYDFTEAARSAALYASRRAAWEVLVGRPGFWCSVTAFYEQGRWPCGLLPNGALVVLRRRLR